MKSRWGEEGGEVVTLRRWLRRDEARRVCLGFLGVLSQVGAWGSIKPPKPQTPSQVTFLLLFTVYG